MFPRRIRFGWETEPTGPGAKVVIFSKIDTYGCCCQTHHRCQFRLGPPGPVDAVSNRIGSSAKTAICSVY